MRSRQIKTRGVGVRNETRLPLGNLYELRLCFSFRVHGKFLLCKQNFSMFVIIVVLHKERIFVDFSPKITTNTACAQNILGQWEKLYSEKPMTVSPRRKELEHMDKTCIQTLRYSDIRSDLCFVGIFFSFSTVGAIRKSLTMSVFAT